MAACAWCGSGDAVGTCPRSLTCPTCAAPPGAPCRRPSGHRAAELHADRVRLAESTEPNEGEQTMKTKTCARCGRTGGDGYRKSPLDGAMECRERAACALRQEAAAGQGCIMCDVSAVGRCDLHAAVVDTVSTQLQLGAPALLETPPEAPGCPETRREPPAGLTYRERRERKAERLRGWAEKREQRSGAAFDSARALADAIPFGQPILVGHHSQRRAERDRDRIHAGMRAGLDHGRKAEEFQRRAATIDAQAARAIYDDDVDAAERLRERVAILEAERDRVKAYNASCRKGARDTGLLDERQRANLESVAKHSPYQLGERGQMPGYVLSNLSGNIKRNRDRLARLTREG